MKGKAPKRRNLKVLIILGSVGLILGLLIFFQQIALIYGLSTLALIILLLIVALADLEKVGEEARIEAYGKIGSREKENLKKNTLENIERRKSEERSHEPVSRTKQETHF